MANQATPALMGFIDALDLLIKKLNDHPDVIAGAMAGAFPGMTAVKIAGQGLGHLVGTDKAQAGMPGITSWMKQLPASSWEKMGLQVGPNANNYAKQTAQNTRSMARDLNIIARSVRGVGGLGSERYFGGAGAGGSWGLSPQANAP
jgi:hypothetical protein